MKRVFIVHGWGGFPEEGWFPWLKKELESRNIKVEVPSMPNSEEPYIKKWTNYLSKVVGKADEDSYFVGHSIGCQTIIRYLESLPKKVKVGGVIFVAGWFKLMNLEKEEEEIAKPWLKEDINYSKVKKHCNNFAAFFSDNDYFVSNENINLFKERIGVKDIIIEKNKGHFSGSDNVTKLPSVLEALLRLIKK